MSEPSPGLPAATLGAVADLHAAVRAWTGHIPQNLPYVDLMFAFGFATLGDPGRAAALVADARATMEVPVPAAWGSNKEYEATVAAVTTNFLFRAFAYRVGEALAGRPHAGPLSPELMAALEEIERTARSGGHNNPHHRAEYVIGRVREQFRTVEPHDRFDAYDFWTKYQDAVKKALFELHEVRDPVELADRVRTLLRAGVGGKTDREVRLAVLREAVPLSPRAGEGFAAELLELVPGVIAAEPRPGRQEPLQLLREGELLERAVAAAARLRRGDLVSALAAAFVELLRRKPTEARFRLAAGVAGECLRGLVDTGQRDEADRLLRTLQDEVLDGATAAELRARYARRPEEWGAALRALLALAGGRLASGPGGQAEPILDEVRNALLDPIAGRLPTKDYTELAGAYLAALGQGPSEAGLAQVTELFRKMPGGRITNTWTTAQYYSRFHLNLAEDAVFAAVRMLSGPRPAARV